MAILTMAILTMAILTMQEVREPSPEPQAAPAAQEHGGAAAGA